MTCSVSASAVQRQRLLSARGGTGDELPRRLLQQHRPGWAAAVFPPAKNQKAGEVFYGYYIGILWLLSSYDLVIHQFP